MNQKEKIDKLRLNFKKLINLMMNPNNNIMKQMQNVHISKNK